MPTPLLPKSGILALALCAVLSGCMVVPKPTAKEIQALESPPADVKAKIDHLLPRALFWYEAVEAELGPKGRKLTEPELEVARRMGVSKPELVSVVVLEHFPMPGDPELLIEARRYGLGSKDEGGRTHGHVILLKPQFANSKTVITHELVHVGQQDLLGRQAFLRRYLVEMEVLGYARSPLELEAYARQGGDQ